MFYIEAYYFPPTQQGIYATPEFTGDPYPSEVLKPVEENQEPPAGWPRNPVFRNARK